MGYRDVENFKKAVKLNSFFLEEEGDDCIQPNWRLEFIVPEGDLESTKTSSVYTLRTSYNRSIGFYDEGAGLDQRLAMVGLWSKLVHVPDLPHDDVWGALTFVLEYCNDTFA